MFNRGKIPVNAEFAIADALLDARQNRSGASDKTKGRGRARASENPPAQKHVFRESQILTSSAGGRAILIGRLVDLL